MQATLSSSATSRSAVSRVNRTSTVAVRAQASWAGVLRFFVARKELDGVKDDTWPETSWTGSVSRGRRPFKDGFMGKKLPKTMDALQPAAAAEHVADVNESALGYLHDAAARVVSHNFKGESSEPAWGQMGMGGRGWTGEIRNTRQHKEKGGFHATMM